MNNSNLIEKYFSKKLSKDESLEFQKLYETDTKFKDDIDFLKNVKLVSEKEDDAYFKTTLQSIEASEKNKINNNNKKWLKPLIAVAAIVLITFSLTYLWNPSLNEDDLFATYFQPAKNVSAPIIRSENKETKQDKAFIAYGELNYNQASILFEEAYLDSQNSELLFYEGNALLASNKPEKAILKFNEHLKLKDSLSNRTHWYLALAYLKIKNIENAKQELNALINSGENFKIEDSKSLLKKLE